MILTGKNKERFEKWYIKEFCNDISFMLYSDEIKLFESLHFEMQIGVYLAYYDGKGYRVNVENFMDNPEYFRFKINGSLKYDKEALATFQEAYKEAFNQADILMNKSLEE